jgi:excisionase family DNA binding protein
MNIAEVSLYLGVSRWTVYRRVAAHQVPYIRLGKKVIFKREDIDNWIQTLKIEPGTDPKISPKYDLDAKISLKDDLKE